MPFLTLTITGLDTVTMRLAALPATLAATLTDAMQAAGEEVVAQLAAAAPVGQSSGSDGAPVAGDASGGPLADSFSARTESAGVVITTRVGTSQPTKLRYVRYGTGIYGPTGQRITPRVKRALYWPDAEHPVSSVRGMPPRDFVTPVLAIAGERALARLTAAVNAAVAAG